MSREEICECAKNYASQGFLCSESVMLAISNYFQIKNEFIPKIATGFGAGIGGQGLICGAVCGGIMALGIKYGRNNLKIGTGKTEQKPYWYAAEFLKRFKEKFGHLNCNDLTKCDITTELGRKEYEEQKIWETKCRKYIGDTVKLVLDIFSPSL